MRLQFARIVWLAFFGFAADAAAQEGGPPKLRMDFSFYPYQRNVDGDVDFTTTINASLPGRFSYFAYVNNTGFVTDGSAAFARSEQNLRFAISDSLPLDLNFQGVLIRGDGNDFYQLGIGWRIHDTPGLSKFFDRINLIWRTTLQAKRFEFDADENAWQVEHFFRMNLSERLYFSGFIDQTFDLNTSDALPDVPLVTELQLGVKLFDNFYAIAEYRNNDFRVGSEDNLAAGIEYKFRW